MFKPRHPLYLLALPAALAGAGPAAAQRGAAPAVRLLRVQQAGDATYFHVRFDTPGGMTGEGDVRLVPQDDHTRNVCRRAANEPGRDRPAPLEAPRDAALAPVAGLEFVGIVAGDLAKATFLLQYPTEGRPLLLDRLRPPRQPRITWRDVPVTLDLAKAEKVRVPDAAQKRKEHAGKPQADPRRPGGVPMPGPAVADDLEGLWAQAQCDHFARLAGSDPEFGFYGFAEQATARKYGTLAPTAFNRVAGGYAGREVIDRRLFETTTGATAIAESLQLERMLNAVAPGDAKQRTVPVESIPGIDVAEHPWQKMMGDKKPAEEPLARLVPADNYYVTFKNVRKLLEFNDLLEQWGTSLVRAYEVHSRDYRLKERYHEQLCLESTPLSRTLGPVVLRGIAITGHDLYLREGSDVTVLFHVRDRGVFLSAVNRFIDAARKKYGDRLAAKKEDHDGVAVESFVTPLREVSLHRAVFDDFVVYSNSAAGLRRVLDARKGKVKALADSLDFQYMRTIFRGDDRDVDGFVFLSDPFIRRLVGPADKIKEKRRLEALTSLYMLHEGALYHAWMTGKTPANHNELVAFAGLKPDETPTPHGRAVAWDPEAHVAISDAYNTIHFATPLVELPVDKVTPQEAEAYRQFRLQYLGLWRQYFDPVGMRIALTDRQVRVDTYILPLIQNTGYNELRRVAGGGTVTLDPSRISPRTLAQFILHLSPAVGERGGLLRGVGLGPDSAVADLVMASLDPVGNWLMVRADESPVYAKLAAMLDREDRLEDPDTEEIARLAFQAPVALGVDVRNPLTFAPALAAARTAVLKALPGGLTWEPLEQPYKGVTVVRIQATAEGMRQLPVGAQRPRQEPFLPAVYYAMIGRGFFLSPSEAMLHSLIDQAKGEDDGRGKTVEVNSSLYLSPAAAEKTKDLLQKYLEAQLREQALGNDPIWYTLYHGGLVPPETGREAAQRVARQWLGFVPVSPDGSAYGYDRKADEVVNARHGSARRPRLHNALAEDAPLNRLLDQLRSIRADLRFREDGIHTVLTLDRQQKK
jgi:hypothetical protein